MLSARRQEERSGVLTGRGGLRRRAGFHSIPGLMLAVGLAVTLAGCGAGASPNPVASQFLSAWSGGHFVHAAGLTNGSQSTVTTALTSFGQGLNASGLSLRLLTVQRNGRRASARFAVNVTLGGLGMWRYTGTLAMTRKGGHWLVDWHNADLNPAVGPGEHLIAVRTLPPRMPLLDRDGRPLVRLTPVVTVGVVPSLLKPRQQNIATLARVLGIDGATLTRNVADTPGNDFLPVTTLRRPAYERVKPIIYPLAGVHFSSSVLPLAPTASFGRALLGQVGPATAAALKTAGPLALPSDDVGLSGLELVYQRRLAGTPSGHVEVLNGNGSPRATLFSVTGHPGTAVRTSLDLELQTAAEKALPARDGAAALVAVQASTGQVLAVANRPALSSEDLGLDGSYPPGSTFKVITTAALLARGFDPNSTVPCPPSISIDGKTFTNFDGESSAGASFVDDFAQSCNAAFISLAGRLSRGDLAATARQFGFGSRWQLPLASYSGQAPPSASAVEQAADMIGQGRILNSPLGMALVAAAVDSGSWHPPTLITDPSTPQPSPPHTLSPASVNELRTLMRAVVTSGTGTPANLPGQPVFGKTGTAEYGSANPPLTDAWFIGFRGDIAFAVIVQGGGVGGQVAAPIAASFLQPGS